MAVTGWWAEVSPAVAVPVMAAVAGMGAVVVAANSVAAAPLVTVSAQMLAPAVAVSYDVAPPVMAASADAGAPQVVAGVVPPVMAATADMPTPSVSADAAVGVPVSIATAGMLAPGVAVSYDVAVPTMTVTAAAVDPVVTAGVTIDAPIAAATAGMPVPLANVGVNAQIDVPATTATATALAPVVAASVYVDTPVSTVAAQMLTPAVSVGVSIAPPVMTATAAAVAPAVSTGANYADNFNRSNNASLGANWTGYDIGTNTYFRILSNECAAPSSLPLGHGACLSEYNTALTSNNHKVSITIGSTPPGFVGLVVRSSGEDYVYASCSDGTTWEIYHTSAESPAYQSVNVASAATTVAAETYAAGDVLSFEANGNVYTLKKNGSTVLPWTDSGGDYTPFVDSSHRKVAILAFVFSAADSLDNFTAADL